MKDAVHLQNERHATMRFLQDVLPEVRALSPNAASMVEVAIAELALRTVPTLQPETHVDPSNALARLIYVEREVQTMEETSAAALRAAIQLLSGRASGHRRQGHASDDVD